VQRFFPTIAINQLTAEKLFSPSTVPRHADYGQQHYVAGQTGQVKQVFANPI
jgi:hypothetical protein